MSVEGRKDELDAMLDKLRSGELAGTPVLVWWHKKDTDEGVIYAQKMDQGDALVIIAALIHAFKLDPLAALAGSLSARRPAFGKN